MLPNALRAFAREIKIPSDLSGPAAPHQPYGHLRTEREELSLWRAHDVTGGNDAGEALRGPAGGAGAFNLRANALKAFASVHEAASVPRGKRPVAPLRLGG